MAVGRGSQLVWLMGGSRSGEKASYTYRRVVVNPMGTTGYNMTLTVF